MLSYVGLFVANYGYLVTDFLSTAEGIAVSILILICLFLLCSSLVLRFTSNIDERKKKELVNQITPSILAYLEEEKHRGLVEKELTSTRAIVVFESLVFDHIEILQGDEKKKLQELLTIPVLYNYRRKQLFSRKKADQVSACLYFQYIYNHDKKITNRLWELLESEDHVVIHGAASALMATQEINEREVTLRRVARHKWISSMALVELMYKFIHLDQDQMDQEIESLKRCIMDEQIPERNLAVIVEAVVDMGYVPLVDFLYEFYLSNDREDPDGELTGALILTLGVFQYLIKSDSIVTDKVNSELPKIRRACAIYFGETNDPKFIPSLIQLGKDEAFEVKIEAIYALLKLGQPGIEAIDNLIYQEQKFNYSATDFTAMLDTYRIRMIK